MRKEAMENFTKRAVDAPLEFTDTLIKKTKKIAHPSPKVIKIGTTAGTCVGLGLLAAFSNITLKVLRGGEKADILDIEAKSTV